MNNNRGNNRRRGRGNNRPQGGGQQLNRIDSRARGNAPQLLEKYRKLAQDAHLNGDRVQAEYYLQFADHYFRVIADTRLRQEEQRQRSSERWQEQDAEGDDSGEFSMESDFPGFERPGDRFGGERQGSQPQFTRSRDDREPREPRQHREDRQPREERQPREDRQFRDDRSSREERQPREDRRRHGEREHAVPAAAEFVPGVEGEPASEGDSDNPFLRDARPARGLRPRGERRPRRNEQSQGDMLALDPSSLPPAIGVRSEPEELATASTPAPAPAAEAAEAPAAEAPAPRKRGRPRKNPLPEAGDTPAAVNG